MPTREIFRGCRCTLLQANTDQIFALAMIAGNLLSLTIYLLLIPREDDDNDTA